MYPHGGQKKEAVLNAMRRMEISLWLSEQIGQDVQNNTIINNLFFYHDKFIISIV